MTIDMTFPKINGHDRSAGSVVTYRGRTLEEILPRIRAELGPDAIILREREGLLGGVGGFFAQRFIEVEARRGGPRIDMYDEDDDGAGLPAAAAPAPPPRPAEPSAELVARTPMPVAADDFARQLEQTAAAWSDELDVAAAAVAAAEPDQAEPLAPSVDPDPPAAAAASSRLPARATRRTKRARVAPVADSRDGGGAAAVVLELTQRGASPAWAARLVAEANAHHAPLTRGNDLRDAVRSVIARGIVQAPPLPVAGAAVAFVGPGGAGKTRCVAALAAAYRRASSLSISAIALRTGDGGRVLTGLLKADQVPVKTPQSPAAAAKVVTGARDGGLVVIDTGGAAPGDEAGVRALAAELEPLALDAIYVTLPATAGSQSAHRLLGSFGPLRPSAVAITHADETDQLAVALEIAWCKRIPVAYLHSGTDLHGALTAPDPLELAGAILP